MTGLELTDVQQDYCTHKYTLSDTRSTLVVYCNYSTVHLIRLVLVKIVSGSSSVVVFFYTGTTHAYTVLSLLMRVPGTHLRPPEKIDRHNNRERIVFDPCTFPERSRLEYDRNQYK